MSFPETDTPGVGEKLGRLRADMHHLGRVVVACSGGVDSSLLAVVAHQELGTDALAVTAVSPAVPAEEVAAVEALAAERGVRTPLADADFTKADVRAAARALGLTVWDKPAAPCLASRIPYGTPVTIGTLDRVGRAEGALRALGFSDLRVRHYGDAARVELPLADLPRAREMGEAVMAAVQATGYRSVTLDPEGLRSGNLNEALPGVRGVPDEPGVRGVPEEPGVRGVPEKREGQT